MDVERKNGTRHGARWQEPRLVHFEPRHLQRDLLPNPLYNGKDDQGRSFRRNAGGDVHQQPHVERLPGDSVRISVAESDEAKLAEITEKVIARAQKEGLIPKTVSPPVTTTEPAPPLNFKPQIDLERFKQGGCKDFRVRPES